MTTDSTSDPGPPSASEAVSRPLTVAVAVLDTEGGDATRALDAVDRQVYEADRVVVIGDIEVDGRVPVVGELSEFVSGLPGEVDAVWIVHADAIPRPDALGALVFEMERNHASMIGSKILDADDPSVLESVGATTDVYGEPYSGLDPGEVDLEQYDVVRDVAFLSGVSVLIRRDLLRGLGGLDPTMAPMAAGLDLSMRARIAGGRIMVAPSSEVLHERRCGHDVAGWREWAGRMRAMLKAYRLVTLAWVIPAGTLVGLVDAVVRLFLGQVRPIADFARAAAWNVAFFGSSLSMRTGLRPVRQAGDEELFRYQVRGSVRLRTLLSDLGERFGWFVDEDRAVLTEEEMEDESSLTGAVVATIVVLLAVLGARALLFGRIPASGFALPPHPDHLSVLSSYAGGWNPAGLGSPESIHPAAAGLAFVQAVLAGWAGAQALLTGVALLLGITGTARLLDRLGVAGATRHLGSLVLFFGPFAAAVSGSGMWSPIVALGAMPWVVYLCVDRWPAGWPHRIRRVGGLVLSSVLVAMFAPLATVAVLVAVVLGVLVLPRRSGWSMVRGAAAIAFGGVAILPYVISVDVDRLVGAGARVDLIPGVIPAAALGVAAVAGILGGPSPRWRVTAWGATLTVLGAAAGLIPDTGPEWQVAGAVLASFGAAVVVGTAAAIDLEQRRIQVALQTVAAVGAVVVLGAGATALAGGRAGLGEDAWTGRLDFVASLALESGPGRVLVVGSPESMPGEYRIGNGYAYRLVLGSEPTFDQAWLPSERAGDAALGAALARIDAGNRVRPGAELAEFAIRWVVALDDVPLLDALDGQVDLSRRPLEPDVTVYENLAARPRIEPEDGGPWTADRVGGSGPSGPFLVRLADNADPGWEPDWSPGTWDNVLSGQDGEIRYTQDPARRTAAFVAAGLAVLSALALVGGSIRR